MYICLNKTLKKNFNLSVFVKVFKIVKSICVNTSIVFVIFEESEVHFKLNKNAALIHRALFLNGRDNITYSVILKFLSK